MKKIGEFTARGQLSENDSEQGRPARVRLFDGRFDTAFKITEFYVWGSSAASSSSPDISGKLAISPNVETGTEFFNAQDGREIAWGSVAGSTDTFFNAPPGSIIDPENLVVEDLYVFIRAPVDTTPVNYLIVMEKYEVGDSTGAVTMAKDRARTSEGQWMT